ncbi:MULTISPECIES: VOC family protein [Paenibacillus]|uniref:VOC family protein n=1 Tax=Paenibacillus TaxID=44249 RepID=UPI0002071BB1|nr:MULTISPECIES: VOC family protein [Paenibacillus]EGG35132.1 3-demethylubiquinone-9 3-methyltransferase domain protein [Paenibacillus sp. HGF5]PCL91352.1 VOC family protein [Paenibacillus lautus]QOT09640.1 VOC family protein [Paenibacillus sp. JNUCC-32]WFB58349.1 VOC family protein [Paenibacillus sp. BR1-192]
MKSVTPFLMFQGNAEEAMNHYISIIEDSEIISITRYGPNQPGAEGSVMHAAFSLKGQTFMCIDSNVKHEFTFTPSFSIYLTCESEAEIEKVYGALIDGGGAMMPLDNYGFSQKFGWIADKFGVSWQLNLPSEA